MGPLDAILYEPTDTKNVAVRQLIENPSIHTFATVLREREMDQYLFGNRQILGLPLHDTPFEGCMLFTNPDEQSELVAIYPPITANMGWHDSGKKLKPNNHNRGGWWCDYSIWATHAKWDVAINDKGEELEVTVRVDVPVAGVDPSLRGVVGDVNAGDTIHLTFTFAVTVD